MALTPRDHIEYGTYSPYDEEEPQPAAASSSWTPPVVRGRDQPFPPPRHREYPVMPAQVYVPPASALPDVRPPHRRIHRGRGIMATVDRPGADVYFDQTLGEWRPIPDIPRVSIPEENWARFQGEVEEGSKEKRRDRLKKLGKDLVLVVGGLGHSQGRKDKDEEDRRSKLVASVSAPMGTAKHSRR